MASWHSGVMPFSVAEANATLDARLSGWTHFQLHTGNPGAAGTSNIAGTSTRKAISWNAASDGVATNDGDVEWSEPEVTTSETISWVSFWSASSGGTFRGALELDSPITVSSSGDVIRLADEAFSVALNVAT